MSSVIYRKYRPQSFNDVVGQEHIIQTLKNALTYNKVVNSYLFCGPHGTGKTSIARVFAKSLNCKGVKDFVNVCLECDSCAEIEKGVSPDVVEIDAASNRGIDEIRELRDAVKFLPIKSTKKVYIIDEVHMLTKEAFNALLKTLEEPPEHIVFILATTEQNKVPPTIISRTQKFNLHHLNQQEIDKQIEYILKQEGVKMDEQTRLIITKSASGSMRDAQSILGKVLSIGANDYEKVKDVLGVVDNDNIYQFIDSILQGDRDKALSLLDDLVGMGVDMDNFILGVMQTLRAILSVKISPSIIEKSFSHISKEEQEQIIELANKTSNKQVFLFLKEMMDASQSIKYSPIPQLPIEIAITSITAQEDDNVIKPTTIKPKKPITKKKATKTTKKKPTKKPKKS